MSPARRHSRGSAGRAADLEWRLREAEQTLDAIRHGEVDAVVVGHAAGRPQIYTRENADRPYRVLIEQMQEGAVTLSRDGLVLYCNQRFADLLGLARERVIGSPIGLFAPATEREALTGLVAGGSGAGEFSLVSSTALVPVNVSVVQLTDDMDGEPVVCAVVTDLTQNRRRGEELAAANERLAIEIDERRRAEDSLGLALDAAGMGSWDLDLITGLARRSPRHDAIFGHPEPLPAWSLVDALAHFVPEDREAVDLAFIEAGTTGVLDFEHRIRRAQDGAVRWLHVKGRTYFEDGRPVRVAGVVTDVTERREVEQQLRQAQKMEAVGQLTGGIAHDFNNLLMVIGGSLDLLARRVSGDTRTDRLFEAARQGVARGAKLNQQLLAFSRRQDLRAEAVCIDDLVPTFEHLLDRAVGETITVRIEPASETWFCRTDPHQLETAILNLAINARDAMASGGELTLSTRNRAVGRDAAEAWGAAPGDYVVVSIADTGVGMDPDVMARVFEPFFTTKEVGKGTGLGLSQVYGFAKQSGGFVLIESEPGHGTAVSIHLPRTAPPTHAKDSAPALPGHVHGQGTILVVEDDADVRATACIMLSDLGYRVREAKTGRAALAALADDPEIALVFSDVIMPEGLSGIELAREIARLRPDLPVLLTSGYTALGLTAQADAAAPALLRKPYAQVDLSLAVSRALGQPTRGNGSHERLSASDKLRDEAPAPTRSGSRPTRTYPAESGGA